MLKAQERGAVENRLAALEAAVKTQHAAGTDYKFDEDIEVPENSRGK